MTGKKTIPFSQVIKALLDPNQPFPPHFLHRFSDLSPEDLAKLKKNWPRIGVGRRTGLLEDLEDLAEADTLVNFDEVAVLALDDEEAEIRERAIRLLWETEDAKLAAKLVRMIEKDPDENVRAAAVAVIGQYVYLGELEQIPETTRQLVEECLLDLFTSNETKLIRRKALESLGYSGRDEVATLIENAFSTNDKEWMASALLAMGRSADIRWEPRVLKMLNSDQPEVQEEAVRAAGGLELASAREPLLELLEEKDTLDEGVYGALIWTLSQIGGSRVRQALEKLAEEAEDDNELDYLENVLENLEFSESFGSMDFLNIDLNSEDRPDNRDEFDEDEE